MASAQVFHVPRTSDAELLRILQGLIDEPGQVPLQDMSFHCLSGHVEKLQGSQISENEFLRTVCSDVSRLFGLVEIGYDGVRTRIIRHSDVAKQNHADNEGYVDHISVEPVQRMNDAVRLTKVLSHVQKHFRQFSRSDLAQFLISDAKKHYEARDAALSRLEEIISREFGKLTEDRRALTDELDQRRLRLDDEFTKRNDKKDVEVAEQRSLLDKRASDLDDHEKQLNLEAPKAERRRVFDDLKSTLQRWDTDFALSSKTNWKRYPVVALMVGFIGYFGWASWYVLTHPTTALGESATATDTQLWIAMAVNSVRTIAAFGIFVSFGVFAAKWFGSWSDRHASEEFRLKRLQLDLNRAHWFTELAFQWKDEFKEPIPDQMTQRLAAGLFDAADDGHHSPTFESIASIILGAATNLEVSPDGVKLNVDGKRLKRGMQKAGDNGPPAETTEH